MVTAENIAHHHALTLADVVLVECPLKDLLGVCKPDCPGKMTRVAIEAHIVGPDSLFRTILSIASPLIGLRSEVTWLSEVQRTSNAHIDTLVAQLDTLAPLVCNKLVGEVSTLAVTCNKLNTNNTEVNRMLSEQIQANKALALTNDQLTAEIATMRTKLAKLPEQNQTMKALVVNNNKLNTELKRIQADNAALRTDVTDISSSTNALARHAEDTDNDIRDAEQVRLHVADMKQQFTDALSAVMVRSDKALQMAQIAIVTSTTSVMTNTTNRAAPPTPQIVEQAVVQRVASTSVRLEDWNESWNMTREQCEKVFSTEVVVSGGCDARYHGSYKLYSCVGTNCRIWSMVDEASGCFYFIKGCDQTADTSWVFYCEHPVEVAHGKKKNTFAEFYECDVKGRLVPPTSGWVCLKKAVHECAPLVVEIRCSVVSQDDSWMSVVTDSNATTTVESAEEGRNLQAKVLL
eukprot:gene31324-38701_t